jgi:parallel beta-helix repeat protein
MKKRTNLNKLYENVKKLFIFHLLFATITLGLILDNFSLDQKQTVLGRQNLNTSGFWNENDFSIIHIDNNWSAAAAALDWVHWDSIFSKYIIENVSLDCNGNPFGIFIENARTSNFEIRNCTIYNATSYAIRIYNTLSGIIEDCHLFGNYDGISIEEGSSAIVVQDCVIENNNAYGVYLETSNFNTVRRSNLTSNNVGIRVIMSDGLNFLDNNISNSNGNGLQFYVSDNCRVEGNTINYNSGAGYSNGGGIYWEGGTSTVITENEISHNKAGIYFTGTSGTNFLGITYNNVTFNSRAGISVIDGSFANTVNIRYNNVSGNSQRGIQVFFARSTTIDDNYVDGNGDHGITVAVDHDTTVSDNTVSNNNGYGIYHPDEFSPRESLTIYNNVVTWNSDYNIYIGSFDDHATYPGSFTYNTIKGNIALDERTAVYNPNAWNYNYFSYYGGEDANDDGIGDTAQDLYNPTLTIQDQNPVWWDSPTISITSPITDDFINTTAPSISYVVSRGTEDTVWYNLDDGTIQTQNYTYLGSIDQTAWDQMSDGNVWIRFYVNDSMGWEHSDEVRVIKDSIGFPRISITGASEGDLFGKLAPGSLSIVVTDSDGVDNIWYRLENSMYSTSNYTWLGYVEQSVWELLSNGSVTLVFYANDTLNHVVSKQITLRKDIFPPTIQIADPSPMELFSFVPPVVNVSIADINGISDSWSKLYNTTYSSTNTTWTGAIDLSKWAELSNGTVTIRIWANDSVGNVAFDEVTVRKDITSPSISINSPLSDETFNSTAPNFSLSVIDPNLHSIWYTIDQGITNIPCGLTGSIEQTLWDAQPDGPVTIIFYANDTLGNINSDQTIVLKDIIAPKITVISPVLNQNFATIAPTFIIDVDEVNLDTMWYTIDGGLTNITFSTNDSIDQGVWTAKLDGFVTLIFYANDTYGRVNSSYVTIIKDTVAPTINLITPTPSQYYGGISPNFIVEIFEINLDEMWYTVDGGLTNITFISNGSIDQTDWAALSDGSITIYFYANDLAGNEMYVQVDVEKDSVDPIITINAPTLSEFFSTNSPSFDITIDEINLDAIWYSIDNGITNISITELPGTIDQTAWIATPDGQINIRFYANDTAGNENYIEIAVNKDLVSPVINIIAPETDSEYQDDAPGFLIEIDEGNLESFWYTIDGGEHNHTITEIPGSIDSTDWNNAAEGPVTIQFYARDYAGNIGTNSVTIIKDLVGYEPPPSPGIPGYNILLLLGVSLGFTIIIIRKKINK